MPLANQEQKIVAGQSIWHLDRAHTAVEFKVKKLFFLTVSGRFKSIAGTIWLDENELERSSVEAEIVARTIDTGVSSRDRQLRSRSFLNVDEHPTIRFKSSEVGRGKDRDTLRIRGSLTINDKSKEVVLDVTEIDRSRSPQGEEVIYYVAETEVNRYDFSVDAWRGVIGSTLKVVINVQANREPEHL